MDTYTFRLVVADPIDEDCGNRLFEAGAEDAYPESGPQGQSIGFDREATSFPEAVLSAINDVGSARLEVLRVEPDELVSAADVADRTSRSRQSISALISGARGPGGWPRPIAGNVRSPLWRWSDVAAWFEELDGSQHVDKEQAAFMAAVNEVLAARRALRPLDQRIRKLLVSQLVG